MKELIKKMTKKTGRGLATVLSVILLFTIAALIGLQALAFWLNSDKGSAWLGQQLTKAVETTPYQIEMQNFALHGLFGIGADSLVVSDKDGPFLRLDDAGIDLDIWPLPLKTAWLNIDAGRAELQRIPTPPEKNLDQDPEQEFVFPEKPDVYFTKLVLNMRVDSLKVSEEIIGGGIETAVKTRHVFDLKDDLLAIKGDYELADFSGDMSDYLPENIEYKISGAWGQDSLKVQNFELERPGYFSAKGSALYTPLENKLKLDANLGIEKGLNENLTQPLELRLGVNGAITDYAGLLDAKGEIIGQSINLSSAIEGNQDYITFPDINGQAAGTDVQGSIKYYLSSGFMDGSISAALKNMDLIKGFMDADQLSGSGSAKLNLNIADGNQIYSGHADFNDIIYETTRLNKLAIDAVPSNKFETITIKVNADGFDQQKFTLSGAGAYAVKTGNINIQNAVLKSAGGQINFDGSAAGGQLDINGKFSKIDPNKMPFVDQQDDIPVIVRSGTISLSGPMSEPVIVLDINAEPTEIAENDLLIHMNAVYQKRDINIDVEAKGTGINSLNANVQIPARISFEPFVFEFNPDVNITGNLNGDFDLKGISEMVLPEGNQLSGNMIADTSVTGTVSSPVLNGRISMKDGRFVNSENGINLRNMVANMRLSGQDVILERLQANDGQDGQLNVSGNVNFAKGFPPYANLTATAQHMRIMQGTKYQVALNADMQIKTRDDGQYVLSGTASPDKIVYTLPDRFDTRIPELNVVDASAADRDPLLEIINLDMIFDSKENVWIRGWGLDVQLGGSLYIGGTAEDPDVRGNLSVVRGNYEEFGRRFDMTESNLRFQGAIPPSPYLGITAVTSVDGYDLKVLIRGTAQDPKITFASTPSMPEDQVLAYILFGKNVTQISPFQALQLASTLRKFSGKGGGLDPVGQLQKATGLDDLRIEGGTGEGVTVGAGKYLSDDVYLEVEQNSGDEGAGAARVEIELTPRITVESQVGTRGETGGGIFWEWDY